MSLRLSTFQKEQIIFYLLVIILFATLIVPRLNNSFYEHHGFNGAFYSQIARNYLRYGLLETGGAQILNSGVADQRNWSMHNHHPATYPLILATVFKLFSVNEWAARIVSMVASLVAILALAKLTGYKWVTIAIIITPLFLFYSIMPVFEPILLPLIVLALLGYQRRLPTLLFASVFFAVLIDWPGYWAPIGIVILEMIKYKKLTPLVLAATGAVAIGTLVIIFHQLLISGFSIKSLVDVGLYRVDFLNQPYSNFEWLKLLLLRIRSFYGVPLIITSFLGLIVSIKEKKDIHIILLSLFIALAHIMFFRNITWYHDYMIYYAIPFVAITSANFFIWLKKISGNNLIVPLTLILLVFATFITTSQFFTALLNLKEGERCLSENIGYNCEVFINYYSDSLGK